MSQSKEFSIGDRVFAKVRGFPAWPARIESEAKGKGAAAKYDVFFFGTYESAAVKRDELWPYNEETKKKFATAALKKRKKFPEALEEIESNPDIRTAEQLEALETEVTGAAPPPLPADGEQSEVPLTIDENVGSKKKTPAAASKKRKADEAKLTPANGKPTKVRKATGRATPNIPDPETTPTSTEPEKLSRSGRVIKPKRFNDDLEQEDTPKKGEKKDARKMWVQVKATGDMIEINLDENRPARFETKDLELQWERATAKNALLFKEKVESGEFIPEEIRRKIEMKVNRTPEEEEILKRAKQLDKRREKARWLKVEQKMLELDLKVKRALSVDKPDLPTCMDALKQLRDLPMTPLMLKKQPDIVGTVRRLRKYVGPPTSDDKAKEEWLKESQQVRLVANQIFMRLQSAFTVPEGGDFWAEFDSQVVSFRNATKDMDRSKVLSLVSDPTKQSKK